jgi:hypothetical protein
MVRHDPPAIGSFRRLALGLAAIVLLTTQPATPWSRNVRRRSHRVVAAAAHRWYVLRDLLPAHGIAIV